MTTNRPNRDRIPIGRFTSITIVAAHYSLSPNASSKEAQNLIGNTGGKTPTMVSLPRVDCPECGRDTAVYPGRILYRHDPASGRTPELKSCPGSLKKVRAPKGELLLFDDPNVDWPEEPAPPGLF